MDQNLSMKSTLLSLLLVFSAIPFLPTATAATVTLADQQVLTSSVYADTINLPLGATVYFAGDITLSANSQLRIEGSLRSAQATAYDITLVGGNVVISGTVVAGDGQDAGVATGHAFASGQRGGDGGSITVTWPALKTFTLAEGAIIRSGDGGDGGDANVTSNESSPMSISATGGDGGNGGGIAIAGTTALIYGVLDLGSGGEGGYAHSWSIAGTPPADNGTTNATGGDGGAAGSASLPASFSVTGLVASGVLVNGNGGPGGVALAPSVIEIPTGESDSDVGGAGCDAGVRSSPSGARGYTACNGGSAYAEGGKGGPGLSGGTGGAAWAYGGRGGRGGTGVSSGAAALGTNCILRSDGTNCPGVVGGMGGYGGIGGYASAYGGEGGVGVLAGGRGGAAHAYGGNGGQGGDGGRGGGIAVWDQVAFHTDLFFCVVDIADRVVDGCVTWLISLPTYDHIVCGGGGDKGIGGWGAGATAEGGKGGTGASAGGAGADDPHPGSIGARGARGADGSYYMGNPGWDECLAAEYDW